jgi:hypothetical protein
VLNAGEDVVETESGAGMEATTSRKLKGRSRHART